MDGFAKGSMMRAGRSEPTYLECLTSIFVGSFPIFLIFGIAALFGADTVIFNGERVYGWIALLDAMILNVVWSILFAMMQKFGFLLVNLVRTRRLKG